MEGNNQENNETAENKEYFRSLPTGYRFHPTDQELILYYLKPKILNQPLPRNRIHTNNIYQFHPKQLTDDYEKIREDGWYFFSERERKYQNGTRPNRKADDGYWKATGYSLNIKDENDEVIGHKKVLEYKKGAHTENIKTDWKMYEYTLQDEKEDVPLPKRKKGEGNMKLDRVLCKLYLNTRANGSTNSNGEITTEISDQGMVTNTGTSRYRETVLKQEANQVQPLDSSQMSSLPGQFHTNTSGAFNHMDHIWNSSTIPDTCFHSPNPINRTMVTDTVTSHHHDNMLVPKQEAGQVLPLDSSLAYSRQPQVHNNTTGGFNHLDHISNSSSTPENCFFSSTSMSNGVYDSTNCTHYGEFMHNGGSGSVYQWGSSFTQFHHQNHTNYMYSEEVPSSSTLYPSDDHALPYSSTKIWTQLQPENHEISRVDGSTFNHLDHISNSSSTPENCFYSSTSMSNGVYDSTNCTHYGESMHNGGSGSVYQWGSSFTQFHHQNHTDYMYSEEVPSSSTLYPSDDHALPYSSTKIWTQLQPENHEISRVDGSTFVSLPGHVTENSMLVNDKDDAEMMPFKHDDDDDDGLQFLSIPDEVHENDSKTDEDDPKTD